METQNTAQKKKKMRRNKIQVDWTSVVVVALVIPALRVLASFA